MREADREYTETHFTIATRPLVDLPGYAAYVEAFDAAKAEVKTVLNPLHDQRRSYKYRSQA